MQDIDYSLLRSTILDNDCYEVCVDYNSNTTLDKSFSLNCLYLVNTKYESNTAVTCMTSIETFN